MKHPWYSLGLRMALAALLALSLWVFVSFTENPQQNVPLTNLPVSAEGLAAGLTLVDSTGVAIAIPDAQVNATMVGPRNLLATLSKQNAQPYINLAGLSAGIHTVPINIRVVPSRQEIRFLDIVPETVTVEIEAVISATVPLSVTTSGQPPTSYEASTPLVTLNNQPLETLVITGPASQVQRVVAGEITVDLSSQTANIRTERSILPIDAIGREVEGVSIKPERALVAINILSSSGIKRVPIVPVVLEIPPPGFRPVVTMDPAFVSVIGSSRALAGVDFIETEPISLPSDTTEITRTVRLRFPSGITPRDASDAEVSVASIRLAPITTGFQMQLPVVARNPAPEHRVFVEPSLVLVTLRGSASAFQNTTLQLVIDLEGRGVGSYSLTPTVVLPEGLELAEPLNPIKITILAPPIPTPTPSPIPTLQPDATLEPTPNVTPSITPTITVEPPTITPVQVTPTP